MARFSWLLALLPFAQAIEPSPSRPWESYIKSPSTRLVPPKRIHAITSDAEVTTAQDGSYILTLPADSQISLEFPYVGGLISLNTSNVTNITTPHFSLAFAESPSFVREISDDTGAVPTQDYDKALNVSLAPSQTSYKMPTERFRGGFKYLTIHAFAPVTLSNIICHLAYSPSQPDPSAYHGHFHTPDDDLLTRAWYAGVFTAQTNI
ncbi:unnamed protein product, partial [Colletotrichum noveboracense]